MAASPHENPLPYGWISLPTSDGGSVGRVDRFIQNARHPDATMARMLEGVFNTLEDEEQARIEERGQRPSAPGAPRFLRGSVASFLPGGLWQAVSISQSKPPATTSKTQSPATTSKSTSTASPVASAKTVGMVSAVSVAAETYAAATTPPPLQLEPKAHPTTNPIPTAKRDTSPPFKEVPVRPPTA